MFQYEMITSRNEAWRMLQSKTTISQFPFIHTELNKDPSSRNWGTMRFTGVDWAIARKSPAFRSSIVQAHHNIRAMRIQLESGKAMAAEVDKIMNSYGYSRDTTWYEQTGEAIERAAADRVRVQISPGSGQQTER
jgi:hypothetical protein